MSAQERMYCSEKSPYNFEIMDSMAERHFAKTLDQSDDVLYWTKNHGIEIPYQSAEKRLKIRAYHPDFWVKFKNGSLILFEVKGRHMKDKKDVIEKEIAAQLWCLARNCNYKMKYDNETHEI